MTNPEDFTIHNDVPAVESSPQFIKTEDLSERPEKVDYSRVYVLPSIKTRFFSVLIDVLIIVLMALGISKVFDTIGEVPGWIRGVFFVLFIWAYEPVLVTLGSTAGQWLLNIRVRSFKDPDKKVAFHMVVLRFLVKATLGWLSFITVTFNINRRAIHDYLSGSIMISKKLEEK